MIDGKLDVIYTRPRDVVGATFEELLTMARGSTPPARACDDHLLSGRAVRRLRGRPPGPPAPGRLRALRRLAPRRGRAADLAGQLYLAWPRIHSAGREEAYARQIIVRATIDEARRPWRRRERSGIEERDVPARADLPYEERSALLDALHELPTMQRRVVVLRYWLGLSVEETATDLGISTGTVKSHASRGLESLRGLLQETGRTA